MIIKHKNAGTKLIAYNADLSFVYAGPLCGFLPGEPGDGALYSEVRVIVTSHACGSIACAFEFLKEATVEEFRASAQLGNTGHLSKLNGEAP